MDTLGSRLKHLRAILDKSQKEMSRYLNCAPSTYAMYEQDQREPNIDMLINMSDFFNVSLDYLLRGSEFVKKEMPDSIRNELQHTLIEIEKEIENLKEKLDYVKKYIES